MKLNKGIPFGPYCYDENGICQYWSKDESKPDTENGYCGLLKQGDWDFCHTSLLWDQCKECDIRTVYDLYLT